MNEIKRIQGNSTRDFVISGEFIFVDEPIKFIGKCKNKIIVLKSATPDIILLMNEATAVVAENGGVTCHLAVFAREMGLPCIVGASGVVKLIENKKTVSIVANSGVGEIYAE